MADLKYVWCQDVRAGKVIKTIPHPAILPSLTYSLQSKTCEHTYTHTHTPASVPLPKQGCTAQAQYTDAFCAQSWQIAQAARGQLHLHEPKAIRSLIAFSIVWQCLVAVGRRLKQQLHQHKPKVVHILIAFSIVWHCLVAVGRQLKQQGNNSICTSQKLCVGTVCTAFSIVPF